MAVPAFAPLPPAKIRLSIGPEEWEACLEAWLTLSEFTLRLPKDTFNKTASDDGSLPGFLTSFYHELGTAQTQDCCFNGPAGVSLRKVCFRLVSRIFIETDAISQTLTRWDFLADFCHAHVRSSALPRLMSKAWEKRTGQLTPTLQKQKDSLVRTLESKQIDSTMSTLAQLGSIAHASSDIGSLFMTGSDFLDSVVGVYSHSTSDAQRKALSTVTYLCLASLVKTDVSNTSLLSDHLYVLKVQADKGDHSASLLADVVTNTPLLAKLRLSLSEKTPDRLSKLLDTLETYRSPSIARRRKHPRSKQSKGKGKQNPASEPANIHRMSLITQIQDLFPDLGAGFILKLLDEYNDDVEQVTAHLLDDSLPTHLASLDRSEDAPQIYDQDQQTQIDHLAPRSTPPKEIESFIPERRNVFDDDELDRLEFSTNRLHIGKQNRSHLPTSDTSNKAAIMSALAAFDSDDDERDDTYDVEDVGGTVDTAHPDGEPAPSSKMSQQETDTVLFNAYKSNPELFGRTFNIRRAQPRMELKRETGMTDEAIEGWAIMLQRDPSRLKRLESKLSAFDGRQTELASTSYRESPGGTETEDSDAGGPNGRGGFRGRGRGRGGRGRGGGRGGSVAGAADDPGTANAQRRKEANKGSRANHNRRDGRARKMARGGFPPAG